MKRKSKIPSLSNAEYNIMRVLWKYGEKSVREIYEHLLDTQGWAITTIRTMMDRMTAKRLLKKVNSHGVFVFGPLISRPAGLANIVRFFAQKVLETDTGTVVSMFSDKKGLSAEEVEELKRILDEE